MCARSPPTHCAWPIRAPMLSCGTPMHFNAFQCTSMQFHALARSSTQLNKLPFTLVYFNALFQRTAKPSRRRALLASSSAAAHSCPAGPRRKRRQRMSSLIWPAIKPAAINSTELDSAREGQPRGPRTRSRRRRKSRQEKAKEVRRNNRLANLSATDACQLAPTVSGAPKAQRSGPPCGPLARQSLSLLAQHSRPTRTRTTFAPPLPPSL